MKIEENIKINIDENSQSILYINKSDDIKFTESEEYKLSINNNVKSLSGSYLKEEFTSYFAVNYSFNLDSQGISGLNNNRSMIICISDIHLGVNDSYAEINRNRDALVNFLKSNSEFLQM